jgi:putative ABC transport system permease protein
LLVTGAVLIVIGLTGELSILGIGTALLFMGLFVLGPLIARPVARVLGAPIARLRGLSGGLARQNAMRNPKRTARTAAALVVGVALVAAITVFAASIKSSIRSIIGKQFTGDFVVATKTFGFGGLPSSLSLDLSKVDGVAAAAGVQIGGARIDGEDQGITVIDPKAAVQVFDLGLEAGTIEGLDDSGILLSKDRSESTGLGVGDTLTVQFLDGSTHELTVQGIYAKEELAGPFSITSSLYESTGADMYVFSIFLKMDGGASADAVEAGLTAALEPYPMADLQSRQGYIDAQAASIDSFVNLIYGLLALAVIIAVFGIANTLSLSVYERTRELGLLRAVGATRGQVRAMIRWESVITALLGAVQGIVVGCLLGWATVLALKDQGFKEFTLPVPTLAVVLAIAILCGVIAATRPARRASRLDVLEAIHSE